jgi:hypothetical protein
MSGASPTSSRAFGRVCDGRPGQHARCGVDVVAAEVIRDGGHVEGAVLRIRCELEPASGSRISGLATAQPSRSPGARILEKLPRCRTRPSVSRLFSVGSDVPPMAQRPIGRVLHHEHAAKFASSIRRCRRSRLIVQPWGSGSPAPCRSSSHPDGPARHLLQMLGIHSVSVGPYRRVLRLCRRERDQLSEERRALGNDHVPGVHHELGGQVQTLLGPLTDKTSSAAHEIPSRVSRSATSARSISSPFDAVYRKAVACSATSSWAYACCGTQSGTAPGRGIRRRRR